MKFLSKISSLLGGMPSDLLGNPFLMICDCETTGYSEKKHNLIEFSASIHDFELDKKDEITVYARPKETCWTKKAEEIHGYSLSEALEFPAPRKTAIELLHFLKPFKTDDNKPILFISHDTSGFDYRFTKAFFVNTLLHESFFKVFKDDYKLSTINIARSLGYKDNKLNVWAERLNKELDHHKAESDRIMCFEVFKYLLEKMEAQVEIEIEKNNNDKKTT